jgi:DNA polymerase
MERGGAITPAEAASLLSWWADAGVDTLIDETPRDWLRPASPAPNTISHPGESRGPAPTSGKSEQTPALLGPGVRRDDSAGLGREHDTPPDQLDLFRAWLKDSPNLPFAAPQAPRVCPSGDPASGLMMLADMPGAQDCSSGTLLSGDAGRLFDRMLAAIGRDRDSIYLASLSCLRSPDGRIGGEPGGRCAALARHHIGLARPRALLLFGDAASTALLGLNMAQARGRWHDLATHAGPVKAMVTLPPELLLRSPRLKAHAWADLQMLMQGLNP